MTIESNELTGATEPVATADAAEMAESSTKPTKYYVDFENVHGAGLKGVDALGENDEVIIIYSQAAETFHIENAIDIMRSKARVSFVEADAGTRNAADFQLIVALYADMDEGFDYAIVSGDGGFDAAIKMGDRMGKPTVRRLANVAGDEAETNDKPKSRRGRRGRSGRDSAKETVAEDAQTAPAEPQAEAAPAQQAEALPEASESAPAKQQEAVSKQQEAPVKQQELAPRKQELAAAEQNAETSEAQTAEQAEEPKPSSSKRRPRRRKRNGGSSDEQANGNGSAQQVEQASVRDEAQEAEKASHDEVRQPEQAEHSEHAERADEHDGAQQAEEPGKANAHDGAQQVERADAHEKPQRNEKNGRRKKTPKDNPTAHDGAQQAKQASERDEAHKAEEPGSRSADDTAAIVKNLLEDNGVQLTDQQLATVASALVGPNGRQGFYRRIIKIERQQNGRALYRQVRDHYSALLKAIGE